MNIQQLKDKFIEVYGSSHRELEVFFSPGRVNLIGEHIDYNGGFVFPAALTIGVYAVSRRRDDNVINLKSLNVAKSVSFSLDEPISYMEEDDWANYPKGVARELLARGNNFRGMDLLYYGNLPHGSGLSSSAALEVLTAYMLLNTNGVEADRVELARLCQKVENEFMGINCGIMDQFSVALGKKDNAILLNCSSLEYKYAPIKLEGASIVLINTNKRRELADSKYNERRAECDRALELIKAHKSIEDLCSANLDDVNEYIKDETLQKRARHVVAENQRVLKAIEALNTNDIAEFGRLMLESHKSLRYDYEVTGAELDAIVDGATNVDGCIGCRMTGAGFGGCAVAIVENDKLNSFKQKVAEYYTAKTGLNPSFYESNIGDGVGKL